MISSALVPELTATAWRAPMVGGEALLELAAQLAERELAGGQASSMRSRIPARSSGGT